MSSEEVFADADIDGLEERSWFGSWLRGLLVGLVLAVVGVIALSLSTPLPEHLPGVGKVEIVRNDVGTVAVPVDGSSASEAPTVSDDAAQPEAETQPKAAEAPKADDPQEEVTSDAASEDQQPSSSEGGDASEPVASTEPEADAQPEPKADALPESASTEEAATEDAAATTAQPVADETPAPEAETVAADDKPDPVTPETSGLATASADEEPASTQPDSTEPSTTEAEDREDQDATAAEEDPTKSSETAASEDAEPETSEQPSEEVSEDTASADTASDEGTPTETSDQADAAQPETSQETAADDQEVAALDPEKPTAPDPLPEINLPGPALSVNARAFDPPEGAALLAVVLRDADNGSIGAETLQLMTMPLTLAIGPGEEGRDLAVQARAAGHEVLAQIPMAKSEDATDGTLAVGQAAEELSAETTRLMAGLDLAIGATAPHEAPLLRDPDGMAAIMDPLVPHGFVWVDPRLGIGSAAKGVADIRDMTWSAGDRYVDAPATDEKVYQNLESAAALARRQGTSIVFVTASQDALKALVRWGLNRGGRQVWFAPVSAVIKRRQER